jgi:hypothetical protein
MSSPNLLVPTPELVTYPALLAGKLPIIVVGGVDTSGIRGDYSSGLPAQLTVAAVGRVACASVTGKGGAIWQGTVEHRPRLDNESKYISVGKQH